MIDIQGAVRSRLVADATLAGLLASYQSLPAVFSDYVPSDLIVTGEPVVVVDPASQDDEADTFDADYRSVVMNLRLYHRPAGSSIDLVTAAERARAVIRAWPPSAITGGTISAPLVTGPMGAPTDDPSLEGRLLTVRLLIKET